MQTGKDLKEWLAREKISLQKFADKYYKTVVNPGATEEELEAHRERLKKLLKKDRHIAPERLFAYFYFFNQYYGANSVNSCEDKQAAWQMYVELDTRIATRKLENGQCKAAVASLAQLFAKHREFSQQSERHCQQYYALVTETFESTLRPFTSKWHQHFESANILSDEKDKEFRSELVLMQKELTKLKDSLLSMSQSCTGT